MLLCINSDIYGQSPRERDGIRERRESGERSSKKFLSRTKVESAAHLRRLVRIGSICQIHGQYQLRSGSTGILVQLRHCHPKQSDHFPRIFGPCVRLALLAFWPRGSSGGCTSKPSGSATGDRACALCQTLMRQSTDINECLPLLSPVYNNRQADIRAGRALSSTQRL